MSEEISDTDCLERRATAYHEAGHAAAHIALCSHFDNVTILPRGDYAGYVEKTDREDEFTEHPRAALRVLLAGPVSEARYRRRLPSTVLMMHSSLSDCLDIQKLNLGDVEFYAAVQEVFSFVECNWRRIKSITQALLKRKTLTFDEVEALFFAVSDSQELRPAS